MADVELQEVTKVFGAGVTAVDRISMAIQDSEMVVFVGPSGCGKTTTLRMIAGLERSSSGAIRIGDKLANNLTPMKRNIAMVFQNYALYPHMTVRENMAFPLEAKKMHKRQRDQRINEVGELLEIGDLLDRTPRQLSGGQQQRAALGRAVVRDPAVLLMDEPLSNLDAKLRVRMRAEIKAFQERMGITTIYVTHDQTEAMTMGDRIAVILDGRLQQFDTPAEIYQNPANVRVAQVVGSPAMNVVEGTLATNGQGSGSTVTIGNVVVPLPDWLATKVQDRNTDSRSVMLGVRPDALAIAPSGTSTDAGTLIGRGLSCVRCEVLGGTGVYLVKYDGGADLTVEDHSAAAMARTYASGEVVDLYLRGPAVHLFDHGNGTRIG